MAISFADKKRRIFAEARKPEAKTQLKNLAKALKNISKFPASERGELKKLVESIYENLVEKPKKGMQGGTKKSSTPTTKLSQILKEFKAKIGNEKWREATRGTDIYRDMERPALPKGKRIVRKKGKTSNQYGTFKNQVGSVYYENRARHSDVNQPSTKRYPKLADGGNVGEMIRVNNSSGWIFLDYGRGFETLEKAKKYADTKRNEYHSASYQGERYHNADVIVVAKDGKYHVLARVKNYEVPNIFAKRVYSDGGEFGGGGRMKEYDIYKNGTHQGSVFARNLKEAQREVFATYGEDREVYPTDTSSSYGKGGRTGKKQIKRKKVTRQYPNYDKEMDGEWIAKPQGYRFTEKLRKKLGIKNSWAKPTQEQIEKYRGRGVYSENRQDKSDVKPKRTKPSLGDGGEFGGGGKTKSIIERIKKANTISEKDINLLKRRYNANSDDESVKEVLDYYNEVDFPKLDADQTKKGYDFLMNLWKSPTGKVRTNNPFGSREQRILDDFSHFEFGGFYDDGNSYRSNFIPIYIVHSKDGAAFEYIFRGGSLKIIGKDGGEFGGGGKVIKFTDKEKNLIKQYAQKITDLEDEVSEKEYECDDFADSKEMLDKYYHLQSDLYKTLKSKYGNNKSFRMAYDEVEDSFAKGGRTGKKQIKRKKVTRQYPNYDKEMDGEWIAKPQGYRFTEKLRKKLGIKNSWAKPTQEQIEKYRGRGVYSENRQDKSDVKPKRTKPSL